MEAGIPMNSGAPITQPIEKIQRRGQGFLKGCGLEEFFDVFEKYQQQMKIPSIANSVQMPAIFQSQGKMPSLFGGKGR